MVMFFLQSSCVVGSQLNNSKKSSRSYDEIFSELRLKADLDTLKINGAPLLHHSVKRNLHEQVAALIRVGANPDHLDSHGRTAAFYAQDQKMRGILLREAIDFYLGFDLDGIDK